MAWIGAQDLAAPRASTPEDAGPIAAALDTGDFARVVLLSAYPPPAAAAYVSWLQTRHELPVRLELVSLSSPTEYGEIFRAADALVEQLTAALPAPRLTFHLSPGTPAMAAVWILLAKTRYRADLIESSRQHGVRAVHIPFDIAAEFIAGGSDSSEAKGAQWTVDHPPEIASFGDIIFRGGPMAAVVDRARRVAAHSVPVLIEGESGTGKELLARAIHRASPRGSELLVAINCGAIPEDLFEAEMFGHERGSFTGADQSRPGFFEEAAGGTLFLDEVGELSTAGQAKLLRAIEDRAVRRVGGRGSRAIDVRVIAATHRDLLEEVQRGLFRDDLYYRLGVAVLRLPPLRKRRGDLGPLIGALLQRIRAETAPAAHVVTELSPGARQMLLNHPWPGNVRELLNTLWRTAIWTRGPRIERKDVEAALLRPAPHEEQILNRSLGADFDLREVLAAVARHYLSRAMRESSGNKTNAAAALGLPSYQTLSNWLGKFGVTAAGAIADE